MSLVPNILAPRAQADTPRSAKWGLSALKAVRLGGHNSPMGSSVITSSPSTEARFLPRSPLARWAVAFFVLFLLLLDLTPLFRFEAGGVFVDIDRVTSPAAWVSIAMAIVLGLLAAVRSHNRELKRTLETGLGRAALGVAAAAVITTVVGPATGNPDLYFLGSIAAFVAVLTGAFAVFRAVGRQAALLPETAPGVWNLCLALAAITSMVASASLPFEAAPMMLARTLTQLGILLWAPAATSGLVAVLHYGERSVLVLVLTGLMTTTACYWLLAEFVISGH